MWNHLVSQKTWQNDEEDKCNVRSAKRGERRGEGEEKIENNVQACNLKSSAQKVSQHRLRDLNWWPKMPPKGCLGDPLDAPWTALGSLRGSVGRSGGSWAALWRSSGALWSSSGALWELWGVILELSACCGSQHLALFWSFLGRSGLHRSRSSQNGRDRSRLVNTNEIATCASLRTSVEPNQNSAGTSSEFR